MKTIPFANCRLLSAALVGALIIPTATADEFDIDITQVGGYYGPYLDSDFPDPLPDPSPLFGPDIDPLDQVYFLGRSTFGVPTSERRAFFIYDTSDYAIPEGDMITDVTVDLVLKLTDSFGGGVIANFADSDDLELVVFSGTPFTSDEILAPGKPEPDNVLIWSTFGMPEPGEDEYGMFEVLGPEHPEGPSFSPSGDIVYTVPLPGAIDDLTAAIESGTPFILTARLETYNPDPIDPDGDGDLSDADLYEYVFGGTDVVKGGPTDLPPPILSVTTAPIPEPTTAVLLGLALPVVMRRRRNHG